MVLRVSGWLRLGNSLGRNTSITCAGSGGEWSMMSINVLLSKSSGGGSPEHAASTVREGNFVGAPAFVLYTGPKFVKVSVHPLAGAFKRRVQLG